MSDRGEYRAIRRALLNGRDFRRLSRDARWVYVALKLNLGPSGIDTMEPEAAVHTLAAQTGATADEVRAAMGELVAAGRVRQEENVIWVPGQLEDEPNLKPSDAKHRKGVQRHVAGLPDLPLRAAFVEAHPDWFTDADLALGSGSRGPAEGHSAPAADASEGLGRALEGPSQGLRSRERKKGEGKGEEELKPLGSDGADPGVPESTVDGDEEPAPPTARRSARDRIGAEAAALYDAIRAVYPRRLGGDPREEAEKNIRARLRDRVPADEMLAGARAFGAYARIVYGGPSEFIPRLASFVGTKKLYATDWQAELVAWQAAHGADGEARSLAPVPDGPLSPPALRERFVRYDLLRTVDPDAYRRRVEESCPAEMDRGAWEALVRAVRPWQLGRLELASALEREIANRVVAVVRSTAPTDTDAIHRSADTERPHAAVA